MTKDNIYSIIAETRARIHPPHIGLRESDKAEIGGMHKILTSLVTSIEQFEEEDVEKSEWIIWSIEHNAWWNPKESGYTMLRERAGIYSYAKALDIVNGANINEGNTPNEAMIRYYVPKK